MKESEDPVENVELSYSSALGCPWDEGRRGPHGLESIQGL